MVHPSSRHDAPQCRPPLGRTGSLPIFGRIYGPKDLMELLLAEHQKDGPQEDPAGNYFPTAGQDCVLQPSTVCGLRNFVAAQRHHVLGKQSTMHIEGALKFFDFGEVRKGNSDLARYKTKWAQRPCVCIDTIIRTYPPPKSAKVDSHYSVGSISQKIWKYVP